MQIYKPENFVCHHHHHRVPQQVAEQGAALPGDEVRLGEKNGAAGMNDPYFPKMGNGGYDAKHYDLELNVDPGKGLSASSTMQASALQDLTTFNLDFRGFEISQVTVNGAPAQYKREDGELIVTPQNGLHQGEDFQVNVKYAGEPTTYNSPHAPIPLGWNNIRDGNYVLSEPDGAPTWFPVNDHPRDKASYTFKVTVPEGYTAVCNGNLVDQKHENNQATYTWDAQTPMASYLATVNVGKFEQQNDVGPNGLPILNFFAKNVAEDAKHDFGRVPEMVRWFSERFGDFPFDVYGNTVLSASVGGAALETQTRPIYERGMVTGDRSDEFIYAHELAHQWFGDSVSVKNWKDIWLNEGFACYAHMMWKNEHDNGFEKLDKAMKSMHRWLPRNEAPVANPGDQGLFSENVYNRGAVTLHALRKEVGDEKFFKSIRTYTEKFRNANVTTEDFVGVVNQVTGKDMTAFFDKWVNQSKLPSWPASGASETSLPEIIPATPPQRRI